MLDPISLSELRCDLSRALRELRGRKAGLVVTAYGHPVAVLLPPAALDLGARIREALDDPGSGEALDLLAAAAEMLGGVTNAGD